MKKLKHILLSLLSLLFFILFSCQSNLNTIPTINTSESELLQIDPAIIRGQLDSGVTYYVKENSKPDNRIELRLIVNTGSIQETEKQRGLAHFIEHMAFNGTKNFPKDKLVKYLESLGMGFGPEINAYTSFDETVYKLSIPGNDPEILISAFQILEDWAHLISFDDEEIEKERGVIVEEWRGGRGVQGRYMDQLLPILLKDSRYAQRLTIGDMEVVKNCDPQELRNYYAEWYRPELMAVAVVGDVDPEIITPLMEKHFNFSNDTSTEERVEFPVPILDRLDFLIMEDPEMTYTDMLYVIKKEGRSLETKAGYKEYVTTLLTMIMFNSRMEEIYTKPDSPFLSAGAGNNSFVRDVSMFMISGQLHGDNIELGLSAILSEIEKVKQNGFNQDELDRGKALISMLMTNIYNERDNVESSNTISEIIKYYLESIPVMGIEYENELIQTVMDQIGLAEINDHSITTFSGADRTLAIRTPWDEDIALPTEESLRDIFTTVSETTFEKRAADKVVDTLFNKQLADGEVVSRTEDPELGITTLILSNGATVILKPTDFQSDEIAFSAVSYGGLSLVDDSEFFSGTFATNLVSMSGLNGLDSTELDRFLTGKNVGVSPWIGEFTEGFSGGSSIADQELMFQLLHLYFTNPEFSTDSYKVLMTKVENYVNNRNNSPNTIFNDKLTQILGSNSFRSKPFNQETLKDIEFDEMKQVYLERFENPSDFYYIFTGNFTVEEFIPYINRYIGSLTGSKDREEPKDPGLGYPKGVITEVVEKGLEAKSRVQIVYSGDFYGTVEDEFAISLLCNYIEEELRVLVREDLGGTYGISVSPNINIYPIKDYLISISFGCEPGREEELSNAIFTQLDKIKAGNIDQKVIDGVVKNYLLNMELSLEDNGFWLSSISRKTLLDREYKTIVDVDTTGVTADKFIELSNIYIDEENYIKIILKPEA